jgi:hypothetical protein
MLDDVEALIAQNLPTQLERGEHLRRVALAPPWAEEVGSLDEAHLWVEQVADSCQVGGWIGDQREITIDDEGWIQAVSKTVGELEALGYLERRARTTDARVRLVTLTGRGREAIETAREARAEVVAELARNWDRGA